VLGLTLRLSPSRTGRADYQELATTLGVDLGGRADIDEVRAAVLMLRRRKGMVLDADDHDTWSAGSFFTNPIVADPQAFPADCPRYPAEGGVKLSAAWLIEHAGMPRGFCLGPQARAAISGKHTLALTNRGGATAADILALADEIRRRVKATFGVSLAVEPVVVS
jgi:UDP-N-acetylmuramate dehydrogenase